MDRSIETLDGHAVAHFYANWTWPPVATTGHYLNKIIKQSRKLLLFTNWNTPPRFKKFKKTIVNKNIITMKIAWEYMKEFASTKLSQKKSSRICPLQDRALPPLARLLDYMSELIKRRRSNPRASGRHAPFPKCMKSSPRALSMMLLCTCQFFFFPPACFMN